MRNRWLGLTAASLGLFLGMLDITVNVALPDITRSFATDVATIQWIIICYVGTMTALQLGLGSAADRYGLKRFYLLGIALYTLAVTLIGLAPSFALVLGLRVLQALGNALILVTAPALVTRLFRPEERGRALGLMTGIGTLGLITGALGGGFLTDSFGWPAIFLARLPICLVAGGLGYFTLSDGRSSEVHGAFDLKGSITIFMGLASLILFLTLGGRQGWLQPLVLALAAAAALLLTLFARIQASAERPILELSLLRRRALAAAVGAGFLMAMATFVNLFILPFYVADTLQVDAKVLGFLLTVTPVVTAVAAPAGGWLSDRFSPAVLSTAALAMTTVVMYWFSSLDAHSDTFDVALRMAVLGISFGVFQASNASIVMGSVPTDRLATGGALLSLSRSMGTVTSVAVMSAIFANLMVSHAEASIGEGVAFVRAFSDIYRVAAALAAGATVMSLFSWRRR